MSILIVNDWFVNQDKTITFYDTLKHTEFANGKTKEIPSESKQKVKKENGKVTQETVLIKKFEHVLNPKGYMLTTSTQFTGFQITRKSVRNAPNTFVLSLGRRMKENKNFLQTEEEVEVLFGLREAPVEEDETEEGEKTEKTEETEVTE